MMAQEISARPDEGSIRSGQSHLARHSDRRKKTGQMEEEVERTSGNGQAWSLASPRGQWRTGENGGNWLQNHLTDR